MERFVQHKEQSSLELETTAEVGTPMVARAFQVLDLLMVADQGLGLSELARALAMSKGSMHRLLKTLEHCGAVALDEERFYVLGPRVYKLAAYVRGTGLRRLALPAMQRLAPRIGETLFLGRIEQEHVHVLETVEAGGEHLYPHISVPRGTHVPLLAGVVGRLVLAQWPPEQRRSWLQRHELPRFTEASLTDVDRFLSAVAETAASGLAFDHGEYLAGVNAVAVPVIGPENSLLALLCALGFVSCFDEEAMQQAGLLLKAEAEALSRTLGG
ncbi:MAG TPA: IclR family transcriptional regulator [Ktedonobacteraceae bacterium]|nr:IclR family transcriptional regulator [Ktedonobacteraceae bacterium]